MNIIYIIKNKLNGKCYIGQTHRYKKRMWEHINSKKLTISKAIRKYGKENFEFKIIDSNFETQNQMDEMEMHYIIQYNSYKNGYNMTFGDKRSYGYKLSEEHKKNLSKARKGKVSTYKKWKIIYPDGSKKIIENLKQFCRKNNLNTSHMALIAKGKRIQHKGFKCRQIDKNSNKEVKRKRRYMYILYSPDKIKYEVENLTQFCKENNLSKFSMFMLTGEKYKNWKGWTGVKV